jgi:hypothetical protein
MHTKTPWKLQTFYSVKNIFPYEKMVRWLITQDKTAHSVVIVEFPDTLPGLDGKPMGTDEEDAAFIVQACNSHDELLEACKPIIVDANIQSNSDEFVIVSLTVEEWQKIRAAIARAEGPQS